jgi:hypothetical protein
MFSRRLFCVIDPSHAAYAWAVESRFVHTRAFDPFGNTVAQATMPVADTDPGVVRCAVCGGQVFLAGTPAAPGQSVACDILGRCRAMPADANLARLVSLADRLAQVSYPAERGRLAPVVAALFAAVADDPAALAVLRDHGLEELYPTDA